MAFFPKWKSLHIPSPIDQSLRGNSHLQHKITIMWCWGTVKTVAKSSDVARAERLRILGRKTTCTGGFVSLIASLLLHGGFYELG